VLNGVKQRLPRFYKSKVFTDDDIQTLRRLRTEFEQRKAQIIADRDIANDLEEQRLSLLNPTQDGFRQREERVNYEHSNVKTKSNKNDKF